MQQGNYLNQGLTLVNARVLVIDQLFLNWFSLGWVLNIQCTILYLVEPKLINTCNITMRPNKKVIDSRCVDVWLQYLLPFEKELNITLNPWPKNTTKGKPQVGLAPYLLLLSFQQKEGKFFSIDLIGHKSWNFKHSKC